MDAARPQRIRHPSGLVLALEMASNEVLGLAAHPGPESRRGQRIDWGVGDVEEGIDEEVE